MAFSRKFNLLRFFSITSFLLILLIGAISIVASRQMLNTQLVESGETANV